MEKGKVIFKGSRDGISVLIDSNLTIEEVKIELANRSREAKNFFGKTKTALSFKGKDLTDDEILELVDIIIKEAELTVTFISDEPYIKKYVKDNNQASEKVNGLVPLPVSTPQIIKETINGLISENENNTVFYKGSMRSGHAIKHAGSVVVIGDMNPGSEIIAEGNVIVLGRTKGLIHAGCSNNKNCFVFALELTPVQLRIGDIITYIPKDKTVKKKVNLIPSFAYVEDSSIYISQLN